MKSVLISIQPKWVEKIVNGEKTIEVRKSRPKIETPFKAYIYCSYGKENENYMLGKRGKVVGEFVCDWITEITPSCDIDGWVNQYIHGYPAILGDFDCLSFDEMKGYLGNKKGYDWHIYDLKIYNKPKELGEFKKYYECGKNSCGNCNKCDKDYHLTRPPQSWCYVEEHGDNN